MMFQVYRYVTKSLASLVLCVLLAGGAIAADRVSVVFDDLPLLDLVRVVYGEIERVPFVVSPEVRGGEAVTVSLRDVDRRVVPEVMSGVLAGAGFAVVRRGGVVWIERKRDEVESEVIYRPRHRAVSYLVDVVSGMFKGGFTQQRGVSAGAGVAVQGVAAPVGGRGVGQVQQRQAVPFGSESPTSATALLDRSMDVLVFHGSPSDCNKLRRLLPELDVAVEEMRIKALVLEVSNDQLDKSALALAVSIIGDRLGVSFGATVRDGFSGFLKVGGVDAVASALSSDSRFRVVSAPVLRVRSGANARLSVGTETPVLGALQRMQNGDAVQSVDYKTSGVILDVTPQIRQDVTELTIHQQISDFAATQTGVNTSPTLFKREFSTVVGISPGDVVVLGGLDQEKTQSDKTGLPFLPSWAWSKGSGNSKSEIVLILEAQKI